MEKTVRSTLVIMAGTTVSRLLGFARDASMAWLVGGGEVADALSVALRLPYMLRRLLGEGTLSLALTTACVRFGAQAAVLAVAITRRLALLAMGLVVLGMVFAGPLAVLIAPGLEGRPVVAGEATELVRRCLPYVVFAVLAAGSMAVLHSQQSFACPSLSPVLFNGVVLAFAGVAFWWNVPPLDTARLLVFGVVCGGAAQWILQVWALGRGSGVAVIAGPLPASLPPSVVHTVLRGVLAGIVGAAVPQLAFLVAGILSSLLPAGHMAALFYAERLLEFPLGILGAAVGMANAPVLARLATPGSLAGGDDNRQAFGCALGRSLTLSVGLNLPAAAGLMAVSVPLVSAVLGHGVFDGQAESMTALALCAYAPALPAYAASRPLLAACHALGENRTPLWSAAGGLLSAAGCGALFMALWGPVGPPLGVSAGIWCNTVCLCWGLARSGVRICLPWRLIVAQALASCATFAVAFGAVWVMRGWPVFGVLAVAVPLGMAVYGLGLLCLGQASFLVTFLATRKR